MLAISVSSNIGSATAPATLFCPHVQSLFLQMYCCRRKSIPAHANMSMRRGQWELCEKWLKPDGVTMQPMFIEGGNENGKRRGRDFPTVSSGSALSFVVTGFWG